MSTLLEFDTGPLNWVKGDIDVALKSAVDRIHAYQKDASLGSALRLAQTEVHQVTGALRIIGLEGAATVAASIEETLLAIDSRALPFDQVADTVLLALETLLKWVARMSEGRGDGELALFPVYRKLRELNGADHVFEGELFYPNLQVKQTPSTSADISEAELTALAKAARASFQRGLLAFLRGVQVDVGLALMRKSLSQIEAAVPSQTARTFWWVCIGFIDTLQNKGVKTDFHVKQLLARIDLQIRRLVEGSPQVAERLMRDVLYYIATSKSLGGEEQTIRAAFSLEKYLPKQSIPDAEQLARIRPLLNALKESLAEARHHWSALVEGSAAALNEFQACAAKLSTQAGELGIPSLAPLTGLLKEAPRVTTQLDGKARDTLELEIATTLLFLQNAVNNEELFDHDFPVRAENQVRRIRAALSGQVVDSAVDLLGEGTRKATEHAVLSQLGREIINSLTQIEEILDKFFGNPDERSALSNLKPLAAQIQGALTMLEQEEAVALFQHSIRLIDPYLVEGLPSEEEKTKIADALSSIGLFVEAYCAGRQDAGRILMPARIAFGLAKPEAVETSFIQKTVEAGLTDRKAAVAAAYLDWQSKPGDELKKKCLTALTELGHDAELIADSGLKSAVEKVVYLINAGGQDETLASAVAQLTGHDIVFRPADTSVAAHANPVEEQSPADLLEPDEKETAAEEPAPIETLELTEPVTTETESQVDSGLVPIDLLPPYKEVDAVEEPVPTETLERAESAIAEAEFQIDSGLADDNGPIHTELPLDAVEEETPPVDSELLEIFLEEARDVLQTLHRAAEACQVNADDIENLTVVRRAFHTLKGSGRMVGLTDFGEVAWQLEQLMNGWLAEKKPATADLLNVIMQAHGLFSDWVAQLQHDGRASVTPDELLSCVSRVAKGEPLHVSLISESESAVPTEAATPEDQQAPVSVDEITEAAIAEPITQESETESPPPGTTDVVIAGIRLSPALYQIFREESSQWAHFLFEEHKRLASSEVPVVSESARRGVHTLAGIAGTTGFRVVSDLAHVIEIYLKALGPRPLPVNARTTVLDALSHLVSMIDSIHAGTAPLPADALIKALTELQESLPGIEIDSPERFGITESTEHTLESAYSTLPLASEEGTEPTTVEIPPNEPSSDEPELTGAIEQTDVIPASEATIHDTDTSEPVDEPATHTPDIEQAEIRIEDLINQAKQQANFPVIVQHEVKDEIDVELLPIFLEEAEELIPHAAESLRSWKLQPDNPKNPATLRRILHTLKGSARMAGAMRLGELAHIMESRVIAVLEGDLTADAKVFDTLEHQFDCMANDVDRLRQGVSAPDSTQTETEATVTGVVLQPEPEETKSAVIESTPVTATPAQTTPATASQAEGVVLRIRSEWVDRMINEAGEIAIARSRVENILFALKRQLMELSEALERLKNHLREIEIQAEAQIQATLQSEGREDFDPLEFDRFTHLQEVTRFMAESVHDISTVQQNLSIQLGELDAALIQQARMNRELQQSLLRVRMVPLNSISERLHRVVRQTARELNKRAQLDIHHGDLELDRGVLEKIAAPIEHLLRNAVAHGLEPPEIRVRAGKPEYGEIQLDARQESNEMVLTIKDDGAGLNLERIREKAYAMNLLSAGIEPSESELAQMIFIPGFSTAEQVTEIAGRGVGMDVVKNEITRLGGRIEVTTETGKGVTFTIYLPLTLVVIQAVIVSANKQKYALPVNTVEQVQAVKPDDLAAAMHARAIEWRGNRYPLFYLPHLLGQMEARQEVQRFNTVVLMKSGNAHAALLVDGVEGSREIVVKNVGPQVAKLTGIVGATVRGDGKIVLILNPVLLAIRALKASVNVPVPMAPSVETAQETPQAPLVLVVDDSLTVRKITTRLMMREGYRVDSAKDGIEALEKMRDTIPDVVLLDVETPRMDGFELTRTMRSNARLKHVPIIMITSRTADKHRNHALELGVNVYLGKPYQEAVLLHHIRTLLSERKVAETEPAAYPDIS